jgi:phospholipid transport system substrate-binding protein
MNESVEVRKRAPARLIFAPFLGNFPLRRRERRGGVVDNHRRIQMRFRVVLTFMLVFGVFAAAQAQPPRPFSPGAYPPGAFRHVPRPAPGEEAADVLRQGMDKLLDFLAREKEPNKLQVAAFLDKEIAPYFDFDYMARWVAGPRYSRMSPKQRKALAAAVESRFLSALAGQLVNYHGQRVRYFRPRLSHRGAVSVSVGLLRPGGYPSKMEFRMYHSADGWKVYDVIANGRSAAAYYRIQFNHDALEGAHYRR